MLKRLEVEGVAGLVSMQFYTSEDPSEMGAVIRFSDRTHLREHMKMVSGWKDFQTFAKMIRVIEIRAFGVLDDPAVEEWSVSARQDLPLARVGALAPPQSTSVSSMFFFPSVGLRLCTRAQSSPLDVR